MEDKIISHAKITRPTAFDAFLRKRLFRLLDSGRRHKAIWVCGPPGAGKTTLVNSYIESLKLKCLWYQVDESDNDISTFFHYMGLAVKKAAPRKRKPLPHLTPEYLKGLNTFTRRYFHDLFSRLPHGSIVVLDNFQEASAYSRFHEVVSEGLKEIPDGCTVILISRTDPPQALARDLANREMKLIGWEELRLTDEESRGIAKLWGYTRSLDEILVQLQGKAHGWVAGLLLMLESARTGVYTKQDFNKTAVEAVFNYFMAEILEKTDPETRDFLMKTAILPHMTLKMAAGISGNKEAGRILTELGSKNFFIERRLRDEEVYQYHPLFREFLLSRAKDTFKKENFIKIKRAAASLLSDGRIEDAARLFIEAEDWKGLNDLILKNAFSLLNQGRIQILGSWLGAVPEEVIGREPWILYYRGFCLRAPSPAEARKYLEVCYRLFRKAGNREGVFLSWSAIVDTFVYEWKTRALDRWIKEFEAIMRRYKKFPSPEIEEMAIASIFSAMVFRQPHHPKLPYWEEQVRRVIQYSKNDVMKFTIAHTLIMYYLWTGNIAKAGVLVDTLSTIFDSSKDRSLPHVMWLRSSAMYNHYIYSCKISLNAVDEGLRLTEKTGIKTLDLMFYGLGVHNTLGQGEVEKAREFLDKLRSTHNSARSMDVIYYHHMASLVAVNSGDYASALEHAEIALKRAEEAGQPFHLGVLLYAMAYTQLESGKLNNIKASIIRLRKIAKESKSIFFKFNSSILEALLALRQGNDELHLKSLKEAVELGKMQGIGTFTFLRHDTLSNLLVRALEEGFEPEYVRKLIKLNYLAGYAPNGPEEWPFPLKAYTLGRFELLKKGRNIEFSRKTRQKPLDLLKAIISLGGKNVQDEKLVDIMWPDSEGDAGHRVLATTLYRLRKLIGDDRVIKYVDSQITLDARYFWADVWYLEDLFAKADVAEKAGDMDKTARLIEKALKIYKGPFLAGLDANLSCVIAFRERLRSKFIRYIGRVGEDLEKMGLVDRAVDLYNKGIEVEELSEKFYRNLMVCYKREGNRIEALKVYNRCKSVLSTYLDIAPSLETDAVYRSLLKN